ncbi:ABC transporter substrate-binding protein [Thalassobacillus sp. CUG 92003]|uniref:ABC transporter substrate-binding protein n=1 Tax=Thalassobacillus sp. CUG 92003 TaxID=2736641 RepID=UPI0015E78D0F|nr:ABC transporter substrate-binding protein [Thalassobacillus sp. CUG 92003]
MKTITHTMLLSCLFILAACNSDQTQSPSDDRLSALLDQPWNKITEEAESSTVNFYMWGGDEGINTYIDEWVTPKLKQQYNITLKRIPLDTPEILQKLNNEKRADQEEGSVDIVWINGENFKKAKENGLLAGSFTEKLPNFNPYYDTDSDALQTDFGTSVEGMEAPWGKVQFVFHYNQTKVDSPPESFKELKAWIHEHPGRFTYPNPQSFTGNAFVRHLLYKHASEPADIYNQPLDKEQIAPAAEGTWNYLSDIKPDLWREGNHYPNSLTELDRLYSEGEVWITMGYNEARAESLIEDGVFPDSTRSFVMKPGSIGNTHFLSIPYNSTNMAGAMTAINFMLSPEAQLEKLQPSPWGENTPIQLDQLDPEQREAFKNVKRGESVLPQEKLETSFLPESDAAYVDWIKEQWFNEIAQN